MKKLIVFITIMLIYSSVGFAEGSGLVTSQSKGSNDFYTVKTIQNVDAKGEKLNDLTRSVNSKLYMDEMKIDENHISFKGNLSFANDTTPFNLEGSLFQSRHSNKIVIGELRDTTDNFTVLHFSIDSRENKELGVLFNRGKKDIKSNLVKLYLLNNGNRDLTYLELEQPAFLDKSIYDARFDVSHLEVAPFSEENWYAKFLEPISHEVVEEDASLEDNFSIMNTTQAIIRNRTYTLHYKVLGEDVYEYIRVQHYVSYEDRPPTENPWYIKMQVLRKWSQSTLSDYNGEDSNMRIGKYNDTIIRAKTSDDEAFNQQG